MKYLRIGEFAARAGVTIPTLRYYDRIGLLQPVARSEADQRLYAESGLARLQQILTLKLIGLSLDEIKALLTNDWDGIQELLGRQQSVLQSQVQHLLAVIESIKKARAILRNSPTVDIEQFVNIIKAVTMNHQTDWFSQFISDDQQDHVAAFHNQKTLADHKRIGQAWQLLFQDIRTHMEKVPHAPDVGQLVARWDDLMQQSAPANLGLIESLNKAYEHVSDALDAAAITPEISEWSQDMQAAAHFILEARAARHQQEQGG